MDRDQVNCLHYLYQGDPSQALTGQMLHGTPPLVWCGPDTVVPPVNSQILQKSSGALTAPDWCLTFIDQVEKQLRSLPQADFVFGYPFSASIRKPGQPRPAFLAISYAPAFDEVKAVIVDAAAAVNFRCEGTGDLNTPGDIMNQVWQGIRAADVVVADITGGNPNVMIEVGMAAALGKEVIVISQSETLPFDIKHWRRITYQRSNLLELGAKLQQAFGGVTARYPFEGAEPRF
jgi:nucleoside 2-deoxyribosyltransferase